jgi:sugar phosphate permease
LKDDAATWLARKWKTCGLLLLATTLNYLDRQTLSILAPLLREDMHFDNERLGWLFAVFYYAYTLSHFGGHCSTEVMQGAAKGHSGRTIFVDGARKKLY